MAKGDVYYTVYGGFYGGPSGSPTFKNEQEALERAKRLEQDGWSSRIVVTKTETIYEGND